MAVRLRPEVVGDYLYLHELDENDRSMKIHGPVLSDNVMTFGREVESTEDDDKDIIRRRFKKIRRASNKQERKIAEDIGGRTQLASGALPFAKGDVRKRGVARVEAKFTYAASYVLKEDTILKIMNEASTSEIPTLVVEFKDKRTNKTQTAVAIIPYEAWKKKINESSDDSGPEDTIKNRQG